MTPLEVEDTLKSFRIIVDTREQRTSKAAERYKSFGVPYEQATLNYGDYCANVTISNKDLHDTSLPFFDLPNQRYLSGDDFPSALLPDIKRYPFPYLSLQRS